MNREHRLESFRKATTELEKEAGALTFNEFIERKIEIANKHIQMVEEEEQYERAMKLLEHSNTGKTNGRKGIYN